MVTTAMTRNNKPKRKKQPDMCPPYHEPEFEPPEFHEPELEPPQSQLPEFEPPEFHEPEFEPPQSQLPEFEPLFELPQSHESLLDPPEFHESEFEPPQSQLPEFDPDEPELLPDGLGNSSPGLVTPPGIWKRNIPQQLKVKHTTDRMNQIFAR